MNSSIKPRQNLAEKTTKRSILVNTMLLALQCFTGLLIASPALIADSIHSASDLAADFVVLFACHFSVAAPDCNHQYGHHRYETIATFILGIFLILASTAIIWQAGVSMFSIHDTKPVHFSGLAVALTVLLVKESLFQYTLKQAKKLKSTLLTANAWHARSDAASSLIAAIGITGSILGYPIFDPISAIFVGCFILYTGSHFAWDALQDLSDRALPVEERNKITQTLLSIPGVKGVHQMRTRKAGDWILVDAHICVNSKISVSEGHFIAETAQQILCSSGNILDAVIHIDPENDVDFGYSTLPNQDTLRMQVMEKLATLKLSVNKINIHYLWNNVTIDVIIPIYLDQLNTYKYQIYLTQLLAEKTFLNLAKQLNIQKINVLLEPVSKKKITRIMK